MEEKIELEGILESVKGPHPRNGNIWLNDGKGTRRLSDAVLEGPGGRFIGKRVRVTITLLEGS